MSDVNWKTAGLFVVLLLSSSIAQARVFSFKGETFASYLLGSAGGSLIRQSQVDNETNAGLSYDDEIKYNYAGEFGFLYSTERVNFRFGLEIVKPGTFRATAKSAAGTAMYDVTSDLVVIVPKLGVEFNIRPQNNYRAYVLISAGLANLTMKNEYILTTPGKAAFGVSDHSADSKASAMETSAAVGMETLLSDSSTWLFEIGYRQLSFPELKYSKSTSTFTGNKAAGDIVQDSSARNRSLNFSGLMINLGLRIYL